LAKERQESNVQLEVQRKSTLSNQCCYFTLQNVTLSGPLGLHNNTKMDKIAQNSQVC